MIFLEVDPSVVRPGWTALFITIGLAVAIALLMISMRRQMRKIDVPYRDELAEDGTAGPADESEDRTDSETAEGDAQAEQEKRISNGS